MSAAAIAGQIVGGALGPTLQILSEQKRLKVESELAKLNMREQEKLAKQVLAAQTEQQRLALIEEAIKQQERSKRMPLYIGAGLAVVAIGVFVYFTYKKRK